MFVACFQISFWCCCVACCSAACKDYVTTTTKMVTVRWQPENGATYQLNVSKLVGNRMTKTVDVESPRDTADNGSISGTIGNLLYGRQYEVTVQKAGSLGTYVLQCNFTTGKSFLNFGYVHYFVYFCIDSINEAFWMSFLVCFGFYII